MVKRKTEDIRSDIKRILELTETRILAAQENEEKIQRILNSCESLFSKPSFINVQKFSYTKFSKKPVSITRLGILPLIEPSRIEHVQNQKLSLVFGEKSIIGIAQVFNDKGVLDGILEIQIDMEDFKSSLGRYQIISFLSNKDIGNFLIQSDPFPIYTKVPSTFWNYLTHYKSTLFNILLYVMMSSLVMVFVVYYLNRFLQKKYLDKIDLLEKTVVEVKGRSEKLENELINHRKEYKAHQLSCQSYRSFNLNLNDRHRSQVGYLAKSLEIIEKRLKDPSTQLSEFETINFFQSCRRVAQLLAEGALNPTNRETVCLKTILENTELLFAEKILKSNLSFEIACPNELSFEGDTLFMESILINLIGKSIHRVPKNGKVSIQVAENDKTLCLEIKDNGFSLAGTAEKLVKKSFDFLIPEDVFQKRCQENSIICEETKDDGGLNVIRIIIPINQIEVLNNNVVQLFQ